MVYRVLKKLRIKLFKIKNRRYIHCNGSIDIGKRVEIRPFRRNGQTLLINFAGNNKIRHDVIIQGSGNLSLGKGSYISSYSVIGCNESISIGENCMISQSVSIRDTDHNFEDISQPIIAQGITTSPVVIKNNVWIGYGAVITKGVTIGEGSIIGANTVVTKNVEPYSIMGGIPAKLIRKRK